MSNQFDSYEPRARTPAIGSTWIWELHKPHARERVEVSDVRWNGEEWWVATDNSHGRHWNDLSRFWEASLPDPDPNRVDVGGVLIWSGRPSFAKDLPSGWCNTDAQQFHWLLVSPNRWQRVARQEAPR